jgi:hypothetical protein
MVGVRVINLLAVLGDAEQIRRQIREAWDKIFQTDIPGVMEVNVMNLTTNRIFYLSFLPQILQNRVKIKYNLNPKIHTRSCVYTQKKNYSIKILERKQ